MEISFQGLLEGLEGKGSQKQQNQTYLSTLQPEQFTDHRGGRLNFFFIWQLLILLLDFFPRVNQILEFSSITLIA